MPVTALSYAGRVLLFVLFILVLPDRAAAQGTCSATSTDIIFGNVDTLTTNATLTTGTITVTCNVTFSALGSRSLTVRLGPGSGGTSGGTRFMQSPGTQTSLGYQLFSDAARTQVFGGLGSVGGQGITFSGASFLSASGTSVIPITVYGRIPGNQTGVTPGAYASAYQPPLDIRIDWQICNLILLCASGTIGEPFTVRAQVQPNCLVAATDLDFGTAGVLSGAINASSQIEVRCTANSPYQIGLDDGLYATGPLGRRMQGASGNFVAYELFRDAIRTQPWGATGSGLSQSGTGGGVGQVFQVFGRVPAQTTPPAGTYRDTVIVTVTY